MSMKQKLKSRRGFTLAEMLLTTLILAVITVIMTNGVSSVTNAYNKMIRGSNAQILLSTTVASLRNELGTAQDITVTGNTIEYRSARTGATSAISCDEGEEPIMLDEYTDEEYDEFKEANPDMTFKRQLVFSDTATDDMFSVYSSVTYSKTTNVVTFTDIEVRRGEDTLASLDSLQIKIIALPESEA